MLRGAGEAQLARVLPRVPGCPGYHPAYARVYGVRASEIPLICEFVIRTSDAVSLCRQKSRTSTKAAFFHVHVQNLGRHGSCPKQEAS